MHKPCPICHGTCGNTWKRNISMVSFIQSCMFITAIIIIASVSNTTYCTTVTTCVCNWHSSIVCTIMCVQSCVYIHTES